MAAPGGLGATSTMQLQNVHNLTNIEDMQKAFAQLCSEEESLNQELEDLQEHQTAIETKMLSLHKMLPNLQLLHTDSRQLSSMVSFTSTLAENVSGKVRQLDLAKSHVTACMQRVEDVLDLKFCTDGVQTALQNEDYEQAAAHIHRFLSLDENVLRMTEGSNEGSTLDTSFQLLHEAESKLKKIVHKNFDAAVHSKDVASVERFFKIFPLINLHDEGLTKFSKYLSAQISETAETNLNQALSVKSSDKRSTVIFADTITLLFEGIARVVEIHQPLVETYYGPGKMFPFMAALQKECDRQTRRIVEKFKESRDFTRKVQKVRQSSMPRATAAEKIDPKELDVLLAELTLMNARAELYLRFVRRRVVADVEVSQEEDRTEKVAEVDKFLSDCDLSRLMQELVGSYIMMEEYFMKEMVVKAVKMDTYEDGAMTSSMVDDAFFIVKKCVRRAMSSCSVDGVCAMLNNACTMLEQDFKEELHSRLKLGFPSGFDLTQAYNLVQSSIQQGKLQSSDTEKAKANFLCMLNDTEVSSDYIQTLKKNLQAEITKVFGHVHQHSQEKLESCLSELASVSNKFREVREFGFTQLYSTAIKPRIKPWVDTFSATSHLIDDEEFTNYEANDPWVQAFIVQLDNLLNTFKTSLTTGNNDTFVSHVTTEVTIQLEKAVLKMSFNRLGGLQFDKELRALVGYLTSVTTWTIRDKFARLTQMATILNLEKVNEILDYWGPNSGPLTWRLTPTEVRQVLTLRVDFRGDDIKRLKL